VAECQTCGFVAPRVIGDLNECDACWKYRKRTGHARPARLHSKTGDRRAQTDQLRAEQEVLRRQGFVTGFDQSGFADVKMGTPVTREQAVDS
jgi:hypothetical protein